MTPGAAISGLRAAAYEVPTETPEADGTLSWTHTTVVVVRVRAGAVEGTGWTYAHPSCARLAETTLASAISGVDVLDVPAAWQAMQHAIRNLGRPGLVSCAMSAVEIALWDAAARLLGLPYFPVTPTFPHLGLLGAVPLPSKWYIEFGEPIQTAQYEDGAADDPMLVFNVSDQVRETIQQTLYRLLSQRRSVFFG